MFASELYECLLAVDVILPKLLILSGVAARRLKLLPAVETFVSGQPSTFAVFLGEFANAIWAYFRPFLIVILNIRYFSLYTSHDTAKSASQKFL